MATKTPTPDQKFPPTVIVLDSAIKGSFLLDNNKRRMLARRDYFHRIIIVGGCKYYKDFILKLIIEAAYPNELIPIKYTKEDPDTYFFCRYSGPAIETFVLSGLIISNPHGENIRLRIVLGALHASLCDVNIQDYVTKVIKKRYNVRNKSMNLKDFHNDVDLTEVFCPLSQPRILDFVISSIRPAIQGFNFTSISLANNELSVMKSLQALTPYASHLRVLNLSYNKLEVIEDLSVLHNIPLIEINLDNNPMCQRFEDEMTYIKKVREYIPGLKILDGVSIGEPGVPRHRRNFLITPEAGPLTDQFLQYYFNLYDGKNRNMLYGMYHSQALFSLTSTYLTGQNGKYIEHSRNLLKLSDYTKTQQLLHRGQDKIMAILLRLPNSEHDPHTFTVDVPYYTIDKTCVISVTGLFREPSKQLRTFNRVFALMLVAPNEWQIINEAFHVSNPTAVEASQAFKIPRTSIKQPKPQLSPSEQKQMTEILAQITKMNSNYTMKCLDDCDWNLEEALIVFRELYKSGKVPSAAYIL